MEEESLQKDIYKTVKTTSKKKHVSKIDITVTVLLITLGTYEVFVRFIISDENKSNTERYVGEKTRFWLMTTEPIMTYLLSIIKSIQLGIEIKGSHVKTEQDITKNESVSILNKTLKDDTCESTQSLILNINIDTQGKITTQQLPSTNSYNLSKTVLATSVSEHSEHSKEIVLVSSNINSST